MKTPNPKKSAQDGRVLILVLIFMLTLSAFWVVALSMTGSELSFVGGRKAAGQDFFEAEEGITRVIDTLTANMPTTPVAAPVRNVTVTSAGKVVAEVTVRPVRNDATYAETYDLPQQEHEFNPVGSGSGVNTAVARRYAVTAEAGGKVVQVGVYRVVPK